MVDGPPGLMSLAWPGMIMQFGHGPLVPDEETLVIGGRARNTVAGETWEGGCNFVTAGADGTTV